MKLQQIAASYPLSDGFGWRKWWDDNLQKWVEDFHFGRDVKTPTGVEIHTDFKCVLRLSGLYGKEKIINMEAVDGSKNVTCGHLDWTRFGEGAVIEAGVLVARTGNTGNSSGPHLHIEYDTGKFKGSVTKNHNAGTTINPDNYLNIGGSEMDTGNFVIDVYKRMGDRELNLSNPSDKAVYDEKVAYLNGGGSSAQFIDDVIRTAPFYWPADRVVDEIYDAAGYDPGPQVKGEKAGAIQGGLAPAQLIRETYPKTPAELSPQDKKDLETGRTFRGLVKYQI